MRIRPLLIAILGLVGLLVVIVPLVVSKFGHAYWFVGVHGPTAPSELTPRSRVKVADFAAGSNHRMAILVTDSDSGWLGLARGLKAHGIPFVMTQDPAVALRHKVVFVYPIISGAALGPDALRGLAQHVHDGGSLLAFDVEGGGLQALFGITGPPTQGLSDTLVLTSGDPRPAAQAIRISRRGTEAELKVLKYQVETGDVAGRFDDGSPGLLCHQAVGVACAIGVDLGALSEKAMNGRLEGAARAYVNAYEPSLDELYRWLAQFYVDGEPMPWLIGTAPPHRDLSILLTHDVDFSLAVDAASGFARALKESEAKGTFFMQTKYVRDFNDDVFFTRKTVPQVKALLSAGMEVGSHSVAHSRVFKAFDMGTGSEQYPTYQPFVQTRELTRGGSLLGELRVSKFMLSALTGADVVSFRAGHLSNPFRLPEALAATGYGYDSSITANSCLTHLPFQLTTGRADQSLESVYEFPVTIEDEAAPRLERRLDAANSVLEKIADRRGVAVVLLHPDVEGRKLAFEKALLAQWRGRAWFASLRDYGDWWRARDEAQIDVDEAGDGWRLSVRSAKHLKNLEIYLPKMTGVASSSGGLHLGHLKAEVSSVTGEASVTWH